MTMNDALEGPEGIRRRGLELFEITPILVGGSPIDPKNKTWLTRQQHFEAVRYWNEVIKELRRGKT